MDLAPRPTIDDGLIEGRPCFVCGAHALHAVHVDGIPDYVTCSDCQSAFVLDQTGDWLMYGKISTAYPETRKVALRQWASPEEVMRCAAEDRRLVAVELAAESLPEAAAPEIGPPQAASAVEPAAEANGLESEILPALFGDETTLQDEEAASVAEAPPGVPLQEAEGDFDDFTSRLAALAGVPMEDLLFDDEAGGSEEIDLLTGAGLDLGEEPIGAAEVSDDWLTQPEEPAPWQPPGPSGPASGPDSLRSLWESEGSAADVFSLGSPAVEPAVPQLAEEPISPAERSALVAAGATAEAVASSDEGKVGAEQVQQVEVVEPPPGLRYRTVIRGTRVQFPGGACAHCSSTPARRKLSVPGSLPAGQILGQRRATRFSIPLCSRCHRRAGTRTPEERSARLQAHLISALVALFVLVVALLLGGIQGADWVNGLLLLIILVLGYAIPAVMLSNRVNRFLPPEDAVYVQTTLLVPEETQGLETAFEWRNREYAERFLAANQEAVLGRAIQVKDRSELTG